MEHVNHSLRIDRLGSNTLTISSPDIMTKLTGSFTWERWHNFTLEAYPAGARFAGLAMAAGSNSDMFWLQTQFPSPPTIYLARYDEFESQLGPRMVLPVSPIWLREALGVVELDPNGLHEQPSVRADGKLEIVSYIPSPRGAYRRVLVMAPTTATIEQVSLYDHTNKLAAIANLSDHQYYAEIDWSLPHHVIVQLHPDSGPAMSFDIEVGFYLLNDNAANNPQQFVPPDDAGLVRVDLTRLNGMQTEAAAKPSYSRTAAGASPNQLDGYRGVLR